MGKKKKHTKRRQNPNSVPPPIKTEKRFISKSKVWIIVVAVCTLVGGISGLIAMMPIVSDWLETSHEKYQKEAFVTGDLKPPNIDVSGPIGFDENMFAESPPLIYDVLNDTLREIKGLLLKTNNPYALIGLSFGNEMYIIPLMNFNYGIVLPFVRGSNCGNMTFGIKGNRLYVSVEFKDIQKEETIGVINYNHWKLYKPNLLDFYNDDTRLEVRDKHNNIVFAYNYVVEGPSHIVNVSGYFINSNSISVVVHHDTDKEKRFNTCIAKTDTDWKQKALVYISKIQPVFP